MGRRLTVQEVVEVAFPDGGTITYALGYDDGIEIAVYNPETKETVTTHIYKGTDLSIRSNAFWRDEYLNTITDMRLWDWGAARQQLTDDEYKKLQSRMPGVRL